MIRGVRNILRLPVLASLLLLRIQPVCTQDCPTGKYGIGPVDCSIDCPIHCAARLCDRQTGLCTQGCEEGFTGDRCNRQPKCQDVSGDPRGRPEIMNNEPGGVLNIFVNLTIPRSGRVSTLQYYSFKGDRTVYVAFWRHLSRSGSNYNLQLVDRIRLRTSRGFQEVDVTNQNIFVQSGDAIGIHYENDRDAIYYHRSDYVDIVGITDSDLYGVINAGGYKNSGMPIGFNISQPIKTDHLRTAAVRVFIECKEDCEAGEYGDDPNSCMLCSENCKDESTCDPKTGTCPAGCISGWDTRICQRQCSAGKYGENCENQCDTCRGEDCDRESGECLDGCTPGYRGPSCSQACIEGSYGPSCNLTCSSHCTDACHHVHGRCTCGNGGDGPTCSKETAESQSGGGGGGGGGGGTNIGAIVGAAVGTAVVLVIILVVVILLCRKKRRSSRKHRHVPEAVVKFSDRVEEGSADGTDNTPIVPATSLTEPNNQYEITQQHYANDVSKQVSIDNLEAFIVKEKQLNPEEPFEEEYSSIPSNQTEKWDFASQKELKPKNRFKNIMPYDHNRVELSMVGDDPLSTYINASFLPNFKREKAYIASSGPNKVTVSDFWRMVWQYNSKVIVMVTKLVENMAIKSERYWPASAEEVATYGDVTVTMQGEEEWMDFESRTLIATKDGEERRILHLTYTGWPDHGVPKHAAGILRVRKQMLRYQANSKSPVIVHCSAGIGRTGTFIAIDYLLEQAQKRQAVDVYAFVNRLRSYRVNMVQTREQYCFIYDVLCEAVCYGKTTIPCEEFKTRYEADLKISPDSGKSLMAQKYEFLGRLDPYFYPDEFEEATSMQNSDKNRDKSVLPAEKHRMYITDINDRGIYINAVQVNGYRKPREFLVTQIPLAATCEDFWSLIQTTNCSTIVCLEDATDGTIWYPGPEGPMVCGRSVIKHLDTTLEGGVLQHHLLAEEGEPQQSEYANLQPDTASRSIRLFHLTSWAQTSLSDRNPTALIQFLKKVEESRKHGFSKGPTIVVCLNGAKESGLYLATSHLVSMISSDEEIDVFQTVKEIRTTRPQFIHSLEQYEFLHTVALAYLKSPNYLPKHVKPPSLA